MYNKVFKKISSYIYIMNILSLKNRLDSLLKEAQQISNLIDEYSKETNNPYHYAPYPLKFEETTEYDMISSLITTVSKQKQFHLITLTFAPSVYKRLSYSEQDHALIWCMELIQKESISISCIEKHQSGVHHAHILTCCDPVKIIPVLEKAKYRLTGKCGKSLKPAIDMKPIKQTIQDLTRSVNYIINHKEDHPVYKRIFKNN